MELFEIEMIEDQEPLNSWPMVKLKDFPLKPSVMYQS